MMVILDRLMCCALGAMVALTYTQANTWWLVGVLALGCVWAITLGLSEAIE